MRHPWKAAMAALVLCWGAAEASAGDNSKPVLVELFTSQGCSACPPADKYIGVLGARDDVVALSFHVNYWDYIGWKDRFASDQTTTRQRMYARALRQRNVYTPQVVVGGNSHYFGSDVAGIERAIAEIERLGPAKPEVKISAVNPDILRISISGAPAYVGLADVLLVRYDDRRQTKVTRGENAGRELVTYNVVRDFRKIGSWSGQPLDIDLDWSAVAGNGNDHCAVIVQTAGTGPVLATAAMRIMRPAN